MADIDTGAGGSLQLRETEVEQLGARTREHDVRGFEVAVDNAVAMGRVQRVGDLGADAHDLLERQAAFLEPGGERLPVEQWHDDEMRAVEDGADVRVIEPGNDAVSEGPDGFLYLLTDHDEGALLKVEPILDSRLE
jgi:hypothetical protein